jgi:uncharacterized repeat protein (TIGR03809 family)
MTHRIDVARSRDIAARWCALAEQRLEYLTELFETGRWRRYHSENGFLENIREAKTAVETWRGLATREASPDNSTVDVSLLVRPSAVQPRGATLRDQVHRLSPQPVEIPVDSPPFDISVAPEADAVRLDEAPSVPDAVAPALHDMLELVPNLDTIEERYPLLRNAL